MRTKILLLFLLIFTVANSQINEKKNMQAGILTVVTGDKIPFKNLQWVEDKAYYFNIQDSKNEQLFDNNIQSVEEITENDPRFANLFPKRGNVVVPQENVAIPTDTRYKPNYPDGIYAAKEDFLNKTPSSHEEIVFMSLKGLGMSNKDVLKVGEDDNCFIYTADDKKLKNVFAVSQDGFLYFNVKAILKNKSKGNGSQDSDTPNAFTRATIGGDNYMYMETVLANTWGKSFAYQFGATGGALAATMDHMKGVIWDFKTQKFDIFKNCSDFNKFLLNVKLDKQVDCEGNRHSYLLEARNIIEEIK
ncbi:MAG: hypothetical protein LBT29_03965 [Flavobacteriaceae bacterium]|jgi:hypothetical protein|nr:hypothetical protein [Flavobacteriaceae bacterium]